MFHTMKLVLPLILFCAFVVVVTSKSYAAGNPEADALLRWKATLDNHSRALLSSWTSNTTTTSPCSNWLRIQCHLDSKFISKVNLTSAGLSGTLQSLNLSS